MKKVYPCNPRYQKHVASIVPGPDAPVRAKPINNGYIRAAVSRSLGATVRLLVSGYPSRNRGNFSAMFKSIGAVDDLGGTRGNRRHVEDLTTSVCPSCPRLTRLVRLNAAPPALRSAACRGAAYTGPHRWSLPRGVVPCRQDTRVGGVQQSVRASSPQPAMSVYTARARGQRACAVAVAEGIGRSPT